MKLNKLKKLNSFSILVIPESAGTETKTTKITIGRISIILLVFTIIIFMMGFLASKYIFPDHNILTHSELKKIEELNNRMYFLTKELESLKSTNERLRYAIALGDSNLIDSLKTIKQSKENDKKLKVGGSIFEVFKDLFLREDEIPDTVKEKSLFFNKPVNGYISRKFNSAKGHMGIDFVVKTGTPVYAAASGYVIFADYTVRDGYMIIVSNTDGYITVYKHCSVLFKKVREIVSEGELIALSGNTGEITTGPHLHFEIWKNGQPINPKYLLINY